MPARAAGARDGAAACWSTGRRVVATASAGAGGIDSSGRRAASSGPCGGRARARFQARRSRRSPRRMLRESDGDSGRGRSVTQEWEAHHDRKRIRAQRGSMDRQHRPAPRVRVYELGEGARTSSKDELVKKIRAHGHRRREPHVAPRVGRRRPRPARLDRERQESLVEERLTDTVIRRRSKRRRRPAAAAAKPAAPPRRRSEAAAAAARRAPAPRRRRRPPRRSAEPPAPSARAEAAPAPRPRREDRPDRGRGATPPDRVEAPIATPPAPPRPPLPAPRRRSGGRAAPAAHAAPAARSRRPAPAPAVPPRRPRAPRPPAPPRPVLRQIPQPVVTGSAATGAFIQLPGHAAARRGRRPASRSRTATRSCGASAAGPRQPRPRRAAIASVARLRSRRPAPGRAVRARSGSPPPARSSSRPQITTPAEHKRVDPDGRHHRRRGARQEDGGQGHARSSRSSGPWG